MRWLVLVPLLGVWGGGCSQDASKSTAPARDASATEGGPCGATALPSYRKDIAPILNSRCNGCHTGQGGPWPLKAHQDVVDWRSDIIRDLESGTMPPEDAGASLSSEDRGTLLAWLHCGAPDN